MNIPKKKKTLLTSLLIWHYRDENRTVGDTRFAGVGLSFSIFKLRDKNATEGFICSIRRLYSFLHLTLCCLFVFFFLHILMLTYFVLEKRTVDFYLTTDLLLFMWSGCLEWGCVSNVGASGIRIFGIWDLKEWESFKKI